MPTWDPGQYARFGDERARPFIDLVNRIGASAPQVVVDLGCGNGPATMVLAERWPDARIIGVDNSEAMIEAATAHDVDGRVEWVLGDLATWDPVSVGSPVDVITSNAALQWVDGHRDLLRPLVDALADDGWLAFQVPGNFGAASHRLMRSVGEEHPRWDVIEEALRRPASDDPEDYLAALAGPDTSVDVWESTYLHVLDPAGAQENPVLEWVGGTGLRPVLEALTDEVSARHTSRRMPRSSPPPTLAPRSAWSFPSDESSLSRTRWSVPTDGRVAFQAGEAVPRKIDQVGGHFVLLHLAVLQPPLTGEGDHADEHLGIHRRCFGVEAAGLELRDQDVFDLAGDVGDQAGEGARRLPGRAVPHQDSKPSVESSM